MADSTERRETGQRILKELGWTSDPQMEGMDQEFWDFTVENLFGNCLLYTSPSPRDS